MIPIFLTNNSKKKNKAKKQSSPAPVGLADTEVQGKHPQLGMDIFHVSQTSQYWTLLLNRQSFVQYVHIFSPSLPSLATTNSIIQCSQSRIRLHGVYNSSFSASCLFLNASTDF